MHLSDLHIHEIHNVDGLPCYASGRAIFSNGRSYEFHAHFAHGYGDNSVDIVRATDRRHRLTETQRATEAIRDRLGFSEIATRQRAAIAAFEYERVNACEALKQPPASP